MQMKHTFRSRFWSLLTITSLIAATFGYVFAQDAADEQTVLQAIEQTTPTPADEVPVDGQFHSAAHPEWPALPGNIYNVPAWNLGDNVWLLDDLNYASSSSMTLSSSSMMTMDSSIDPGGGDTNGYGGYTNNFVPFTLDTNSLWLEVTNVDIYAGIAYANLHMATNMVYAVWATTNLPGGWQVEDEVWPTDTNCQPFTMQTLGRDILFLRAEDWTGVDSDNDGVPDWWSWIYWGTPNVPDANLDYSGNGKTFSQDYSNNITPTVFSFTGIQVANNVVSSITPSMQLDVTGYPYYVATVVDDTNFAADANWQLYTGSSITVSLGLTEGWHDVWIGLLGHGSDPTNAVWQWQRMKLDYTAPSLVITASTNDTVTVPLVQITGYSPEALASINYDISNAVENVTNQPTMITGEAYSTNTFEFTTNYFQCYDVPLANGLNAITIHATDLAGNVTTLTTNITYSATTNQPVVSLIWPQSGMQISSDSITIQGRVDDPTANVVVSSVDAGGNTNSFSGLTGRNGVFWVENVPLSPGTNQLAITVSNAVGEVTTNATLIQSAVGLTVNSVQAGDTTVTGTIGTSGYTVWVNGNQATNDGSGNWTAQISPLCVGGGQVAVAAIPNSDNGGNGSGGGAGLNPSSSQSINTQATVQPPQGAFIASYHNHEHIVYPPVIPGGADSQTGDSTMKWQDGQAGHFYELVDTYYTTNGAHIEYLTDWPTNEWPQALSLGETTSLNWNDGGLPSTNNYVDNQPYLPWEHCDLAWMNDFNSGRRTADAEIQLATGGPLGSKQMNLWCLTASATAYTNVDGTMGTNVPYTQIEIGGYGNLDTNGELWVMLPDNDPDIVTPHVNGKNKYTFSVGGTKYTLKHTTYYPAYADTNLSRTTVGVGEQVSFGFQPTMPYAMDWTTTAGSVSPTFSSSTTLTSPSNAVPSLTVTAKLRGGKSVQFPPFTVVEPSGIDHAKITGTNSYPLGTAGAGMTSTVWIAPTSVSFYRVNVMEVGEDATNIWGFYTQWTPQQLHHNTADHWSHLNPNNQVTDDAYFPEGGLSVWDAGGYEWNIPQRWQVEGSGVTNSMAGCNQVFSIDSNGTAKVAKYGNWIQRTTNSVITTN